MPGRVIALQRSPAKGAPTEPAAALDVRAGRGVVGDHHYRDDGVFDKTGRMLTLLAVESIEAVNAEKGWTLDPLALRRNVLTEAIDLAGLVGRRFLIGEVALLGVRAATPCGRIERETAPGLVAALGARAGLRAAIETDGTIRVRDALVAL